MFAEMIIWGFFAAFGSMGAYKLVEKIDGSKNNQTVERNSGSIQAEVRPSEGVKCEGSKDSVQEVAR